VVAFGNRTFLELAQPALENLHQVAARLAEAVLALLRQHHIWLDDLDEADDPVVQSNESLAGMAKASILGTLIFGSAGNRFHRKRLCRFLIFILFTLSQCCPRTLGCINGWCPRIQPRIPPAPRRRASMIGWRKGRGP
jgi:hypothetical protein